MRCTSTKTRSADPLKRMSLKSNLQYSLLFKRTSLEVLLNIRAVLTCDQGFLFFVGGKGGGRRGKKKRMLDRRLEKAMLILFRSTVLFSLNLSFELWTRNVRRSKRWWASEYRLILEEVLCVSGWKSPVGAVSLRPVLSRLVHSCPSISKCFFRRPALPTWQR